MIFHIQCLINCSVSIALFSVTLCWLWLYIYICLVLDKLFVLFNSVSVWFLFFSFLFYSVSYCHLLTALSPRMHVQSCFARIQDHKRLFLEASIKYFELSQIVGEQERLQALRFAITCAILAKVRVMHFRTSTQAH